MQITFTSSEGIRFVQCHGCGAGWPFIEPGVHLAYKDGIPAGYTVECTDGVTVAPLGAGPLETEK